MARPCRPERRVPSAAVDSEMPRGGERRHSNTGQAPPSTILKLPLTDPILYHVYALIVIPIVCPLCPTVLCRTEPKECICPTISNTGGHPLSCSSHCGSLVVSYLTSTPQSLSSSCAGLHYGSTPHPTQGVNLLYDVHLLERCALVHHCLSYMWHCLKCFAKLRVAPCAREC